MYIIFDGIDFHQLVRANYLQIAERRPEVVVIDASGSKEETFKKILDIIEEKGVLK